MSDVVWKLVWEFIKSPIVLIIPIGILCAVFYKKIIGKIGEYTVNQYLGKLPKSVYTILNNVMIADENGKTHQIDHVVLSKYGIFIIETKNFQGLIKGNAYQKQWTQFLGNSKNDFYNPIHQNYGHVKALENLLNIPENSFISIVCFSNGAKLEIINNDNVINLKNLNNKIREYHKIIVNKDINELKDIIENNNTTGFKNNREHISSIKKDLKENKEKIQNNICPKCGGNLIKRNGKYGSFLGCSNYPNCKYTYKI